LNSESLRAVLHNQHGALGNLVSAGSIAMELSKETTPKIDEQFLSIAERVASQEGALFSVIGKEALKGAMRPDGIKHNLTYLKPNPISDQEVLNIIGLEDMMLGDQISELQNKFEEYINKHDILDNLKSTNEKPGSKFLIVSNHLQLPDQGFTLGFFHKVAREQGIDRLENYSTAVIGRVIGYFQFGELNVIDDVLRKIGSVLKTFPSGGSEALSAEQERLMIYRSICNHHTKQSFSEIIGSKQGQIIFMAPSGEQDKYDKDKDTVSMSAFSKSTCQLMIDACNEGAVVMPVFVDYGADASIAEFSEPRTVKTIEDCNEIGREIARTGTIQRGIASVNNPNVKRFKTPIEYS
jgi:hypothetical protein